MCYVHSECNIWSGYPICDYVGAAIGQYVFILKKSWTFHIASSRYLHWKRWGLIPTRPLQNTMQVHGYVWWMEHETTTWPGELVPLLAYKKWSWNCFQFLVCFFPCCSPKSMDGISESIGDSSAPSPNPCSGTNAETWDGQKVGGQRFKQENCVPWIN